MLEIQDASMNIDLIEKIFMLVNEGEGSGGDENDDLLVRYEFIECFIRMGKMSFKFRDDKTQKDEAQYIMKYMAKIKRRILVHPRLQMFGDSFRNKQIYTLGLTDCLKNNEK